MAHSRSFWLIRVLIVAALSACSNAAPTATPTATPIPTITLSLQTQIDDARYCRFNSDETLLVSPYQGIYDAATGEELFASSKNFNLSANNQYVAVDSEGVIELSTGELLFSLPPNTSGFASGPRFSPDSTMVTGLDGIYAVPSGEKILSWDQQRPGTFFSPDNRYVVVLGDGVYNLETGERFFATDPEPDQYDPHYTFTRDGSRLALKSDGFYDMTTGARLFNLPGDFVFNADESMIATDFGGLYYTATGERVVDAPSGLYPPNLNPDSTLAAISNGDVFSEDDERVGAVYDLATGEELFTYQGINAIFSPSGEYLTVVADGVYEVATGERLYALGEDERFTLLPNVDQYTVSGQGVYDLASRELIYSINGTVAGFSEDGSLLFTDSGVHDAATGALILPGAGSVLFNSMVFNNDHSLITLNVDNDCAVYQIQRNGGVTP
jgi:hypothetical protein